MKKTMRIFAAAAALTCLMAFPTFAAETRREYRAESTPIREELKAIDLQMKSFREENSAYAEKYKAISREKKKTGVLSIDKEDWKAAREIHKEIPGARGDFEEGEVKALRTSANEAREAGDFDQAISYLNQALEAKKARLEALEKVNKIWEEIDEYLN